MKHTISLALFAAGLIVFANLSLAQDATKNGKPIATSTAKAVLPDGITEEMLAPPPVPQFMLEKSGTPLSMDEMVKQARAAEIKALARHQSVEKESQAQTPKTTN